MRGPISSIWKERHADIPKILRKSSRRMPEKSTQRTFRLRPDSRRSKRLPDQPGQGCRERERAVSADSPRAARLKPGEQTGRAKRAKTPAPPVGNRIFRTYTAWSSPGKRIPTIPFKNTFVKDNSSCKKLAFFQNSLCQLFFRAYPSQKSIGFHANRISVFCSARRSGGNKADIDPFRIKESACILLQAPGKAGAIAAGHTVFLLSSVAAERESVCVRDKEARADIGAPLQADFSGLCPFPRQVIKRSSKYST